MKLCFATNNHHKVQEVMAVLRDHFQVLTLKDIGCEEELPETQPTLSGNASQKARYILDHYKIPCFADDSGLEVDALEGAPGVYSARFAGPQRNSEDNLKLLLEKMDGYKNRQAQFRTVISLVWHGGEQLFEGILKGSILVERRGKGGFGYDPIFLPENSQKTLAEMTTEEKNTISHRAVATRELVKFLSSKNINLGS